MSRTPEVRQGSSDLERRRFSYVLSEAIEKFSRLRHILKRQQIFISAEHAGARPATAVDELIDLLEQNCQVFLDNSDRVASLIRGKPLNEAEERAVVGALGILIVQTLQIHELLLLLPREAAKPQASFLLQDCFGRDDIKATIVLTNLYSAYEYRFEDILEKVNVEQEERMALTERGNVLCQAFGDKDSPLAWAVLAHEYGHVIDDKEAISPGILHLERETGTANKATLKVESDLSAAVVAETVADFVAAHVLGPASLMPILFVEMMYPRFRKVRKISAGHPPTPVRVQLVCEYLKQLNVTTSDFEAVFEAYKLDYEMKLQDMEKKERDSLEAMEKETQSFLSPLATQIASKVDSLGLRRFEEQNIESARVLQRILASKQPISSRRSRSDEEITDGLNSLRGGTATPEQVYAVLAGLDEVPVPSSEVITAGWLYRLSSFENALMKSFPEEDGKEPDLDTYGQYVEKIDGLLLKSLELADVHAGVLRRLALAS